MNRSQPTGALTSRDRDLGAASSFLPTLLGSLGSGLCARTMTRTTPRTTRPCLRSQSGVLRAGQPATFFTVRHCAAA